MTKKLTVLFFLLAYTVCAFCETGLPEPPVIIQDHISMGIQKGIVRIKRESFKIKFVFSENPRIFVNFSEKPNLHEAVSAGVELKYLFPFWPAKSYACNLGNSQNHIIVSNDNNHNFFYNSPDTYNFNNVYSENGTCVCYRIIDKIYDTETDSFVKLENTSFKRLYVSMIKIDYSRKRKEVILWDEIPQNNEILKSFFDWAVSEKYIHDEDLRMELGTEVYRCGFIIEFTD